MVAGDQYGFLEPYEASFAGLARQRMRAGQKAPMFTAKTQNDEEVSLQEVLSSGSGLVLFFYPKDGTLGAQRRHVISETRL